jgi:hypothetical protein
MVCSRKTPSNSGPHLPRRFALKFLAIVFVLCLSCMVISCGSGKSSTTSSLVSGNWQITLNPHANPSSQNYSGFLLQAGSSVTGSMILGGNCSGVGPVSGTLDGQNLSISINQFGQDLSLVGTVPSASGFMGGQYSTLPGGCTQFPNTGSWAAQLIPPLNGASHGTLTSTNGNGTLEVSGQMEQGPNTGASNAPLSGTITAEGTPRFCAYLTDASIRGLISGTEVTLQLFGPDGKQITQFAVTAAPDATSISGGYNFPAISFPACLGDQGNLQLTFP